MPVSKVTVSAGLCASTESNLMEHFGVPANVTAALRVVLIVRLVGDASDHLSIYLLGTLRLKSLITRATVSSDQNPGVPGQINQVASCGAPRGRPTRGDHGEILRSPKPETRLALWPIKARLILASK